MNHHTIKRNYTCPKCGRTLFTVGGAFGTHKKFCGQPVCNDDFWAKVDKSAGPHGCWPYMGSRTFDGYGSVGRKRGAGKVKVWMAHKASWVHHHGPVNDGLEVMHICDNPPCVNPAHLKLGTHAENMADSKRKGRTTNGQRGAIVPFKWEPVTARKAAE